MPPEVVAAFAPGRANLIGEHTDYNGGLALPFATAEGCTVRARRLGGTHVRAIATDLGEQDEFDLAQPPAGEGWQAFVRGAVGELQAAGVSLCGAELEISSTVARGAGLSSSAALEVSLCLALAELGGGKGVAASLDRVELARLCSRIEASWAGAQTGLLDQLASLCAVAGHALRINFATLAIEPVPLALGAWQLVVLDSGERHAHASSGYNQRREECARACRLLGASSLSAADADAVARLPSPLRERAEHVAGENARVDQAIAALRAGRLDALGPLLEESHASLRDLYEVSTPAVERAVSEMRRAGASGARLMGGGFGGSVLGLFPPGAEPPAGARTLVPGAGASVLS